MTRLTISIDIMKLFIKETNEDEILKKMKLLTQNTKYIIV